MALTDYTTTEKIRNSSVTLVTLLTAIENASAITDDNARRRLLTQVLTDVTPDQAAAARYTNLLLGSLDATELGDIDEFVDIDRLQAAGDNLMILMGYLEATVQQADPDKKGRMVDKLVAAIAPDQARSGAVAHSVVAVTTAPFGS